MWIVRLALRRPYTFVVMAMLIAILGGISIFTMPVDIFPYIDIPIVSVLWVYGGLSPEEMEKRVVTGFERSLTANVNDIEHIESQSYNGYAVVKVYFHSNVKIDMRWGDSLEFSDEAGPGDFIYVPPYVPHQEINAGADEVCEAVVVRSGQDPIVVNLDLATPEPPSTGVEGRPFHPDRAAS